METPATKKSLFIKDLRPCDWIQTSLMVRSKMLQLAKDGKPYLNVVLGDRTGEIETRVFQDVERISTLLEEGKIFSVAGRIHEYQRRLQLVAEHVVDVLPEEYELKDFVPEGPENLEEMFAELVERFHGMKNPWIRELGLSLLEDPEIARRYKLCPAAKTVHHAFIGGLLSHSLQLIRLVERIAPLYPTLDEEILVFGTTFHDFGKIFELCYPMSFGYTDEGRLVGHITIGVTLIDRKIGRIEGFPEPLAWHLKHLILSHHGKLEYGSPKVPITLEAEMVHMLDLLDSRMEGIEALMRAEKNNNRWTTIHKTYGVSYLKPEKYLLTTRQGRDASLS